MLAHAEPCTPGGFMPDWRPHAQASLRMLRSALDHEERYALSALVTLLTLS